MEDMSPAEKRIYSIGTGGRSWEVFARLLQKQNIQIVADVRSYPSSKVPHFREGQLSASLKELGIERVALGRELGGHRKGGYLQHMESDIFSVGIERLESLAHSKPTVFMCAETLPWKCHRWHISNELTSRGWEVLHLIQPGNILRHIEIPEEGRLWSSI